jgi:arabinogalactan endo-1,4-beta-galactosidase
MVNAKMDRCWALAAALLACSPPPSTTAGWGDAGGGAGHSSGGAASGTTMAGSGRGGNAGSAGAAATGGVAGTAGTSAGGQGGAGTSGAGGLGGASGSGGSGAGGSSSTSASYFIGADISRVESDPPGTTYTDNDGTTKDMLTLLKGHGFNYIRVRTFVDPKAADGYDKTNGHLDIAHTALFGKRIKDAQLGFLLDFHYSDNWADPGKQCVPVAWQSATTIDALAALLRDYTSNAIDQLVASGARPDMVQIGNEITPGLLIHRCDGSGRPIVGSNNPVTGSIANWSNLGKLLKAGAQAIRDIDSGIKIAIHLDRGGDLNASAAFIRNAMTQGVPFDVFAESTYTLYQGPPAQWKSTFTQLAAMFPDLKFISAEYGPEQRAINDILFDLKNAAGQEVGLGTFYWEATHSGTDNAGHLLFSGRVAQPDLLLYDAMKRDYAARL